MALIDIGSAAIDRAGTSGGAGYTFLSTDNLANAAGTITSVEIWANSSLSGCKVATFYSTGANKYSTRGIATIGSVPAGSKQTFTGLSLACEIGDCIGLYYDTGLMEMSTSVGHLYYCSGNVIPCSATQFTDGGVAILSLYATGTTPTTDYPKALTVGCKTSVSTQRATTKKLSAFVKTVESTGKNLFNPAVGSVTANGVTCTVAADGTITLNGTSTTDFVIAPSLLVGVAPSLHPAILNFLSGQPYVLSRATVSGSFANSWLITLRNSSTNQEMPNLLQSTTSSTSSSLTNYAYMRINITSGTIFTNYAFILQLEQNSVATPWEQYHYVNLIKQTFKRLISNVKTINSIKRSTVKSLNANVKITAQFIFGRSFIKTLTSFVKASGSFAKTIAFAKTLIANVKAASDIKRSTTKSIETTVKLISNISRNITKSLKANAKIISNFTYIHTNPPINFIDGSEAQIAFNGKSPSIVNPHFHSTGLTGQVDDLYVTGTFGTGTRYTGGTIKVWIGGTISVASSGSVPVTEITYTVDKNYDSLSNMISSNTAEITVNSNEIALKANQTSLNTTNDNVTGVTTRMSTAEASITAQAGQIVLKANQTDITATNSNVTGLTTRMSTAEASLIVNAGSIVLKASQTSLDTTNSNVTGVTSRMTTAEASLIVNANNIALKVNSNGVIASINASAEGISISASKLTLSGLVTITNLATAGAVVINGGNLAAGTVTADKIQGGTLTLGGASNANGIFTLKNASNVTIGTFDNNGAWLHNGGMFEVDNIASGSANYSFMGANGLTVTNSSTSGYIYMGMAPGPTITASGGPLTIIGGLNVGTGYLTAGGNAILPTASLSTYGWWKDPTTGLIIQYGASMATSVPSGNVSTPVNINWPIAFPTGLLHTFAVVEMVSATLHDVIVQPYGSTSTTAQALVGSAAAQNVTVGFLGIGH